MKTSSKSAGSITNAVMYYHADAAPFGGHLSSPHRPLPVKASVSLGQAGGHAKSSVKSLNPHAGVSTGPAYSEVMSGEDAGTGNWTTVVSSTVEDLNLFGIVTANRIVAKLAIEHPRTGRYPCVSFEGSVIDNLCIAGKPVALNLDLAVVTAKPRDFPAVPWPEVAGFVNRAKAQSTKITIHPKAQKALKNRYAWMGKKDQRSQKGYIVCSLVADVQGTAADSTFGHVISVPGFGDLFLGELIVARHSFHLNMLRAEIDGNGNVTSSKPTNGKTVKGKIVPSKANIDGTSDLAPPPAGSFSFASSRGNGSTSP